MAFCSDFQPISERSDTSCFASRRLTFASRGKSKQKRLPLHTALRFAPGPLPPSFLRGSAYKVHPWTFMPQAAIRAACPSPQRFRSPFWKGRLARSTHVHRTASPSRLNVLSSSSEPSPRQEAEWRCCVGERAARMAARGITGQGSPVYAGPRSGTGGREVARSATRMSGWPSLWFLSLGQARATKRSGVTAPGWPEG